MKTRNLTRAITHSLTRNLTSPGVGGGGAVYPLDEIGGTAPVFAYSTRKLRSAYSGPAIRVIRPSDSAELDIGFVGANLDAAALDAFLGTQSGRVLTNYDQSGNANHATQSTTALQAKIDTVAIGGHRVVQYVGSYYPIPAAVSLDKRSMHFFSVFEWHLSNVQSPIIQFGGGATQNSIFHNQHGQIQSNGGGVFMDAKNFTSPDLLEYASDATNTFLAANLETRTAAAIASATMTGGYDGYTDLAGWVGQQYVGAHVAYNRRLSAGDTTIARDTLRAAFGLASTASARVVIDGDSIAAASSGSDRYGFVKMAWRTLPATVVAYNYASGGNTVQNIVSTYSTYTGSLLDYYPGESRIALLMAGTNDLTVLGRTAAQIYADIQSYAALVRADGGKVIVSTILPNAGWDATQQTTRTDLNTSIRTNWASFADGLADFAADATMGPQAAASNATLYGDGVHPSRLGHSYLAPIAAAAINPLL